MHCEDGSDEVDYSNLKWRPVLLISRLVCCYEDGMYMLAMQRYRASSRRHVYIYIHMSQLSY